MAVEGAENWEGWAIVELMGHRKIAGYVGPAPLIGGMLRVDMYCGDTKDMIATQFYSPNAFYCITPTTEQICREYMRSRAPEPVTRWELPALPAQSVTTIRPEDMEEDEEEDEDDGEHDEEEDDGALYDDLDHDDEEDD